MLPRREPSPPRPTAAPLAELQLLADQALEAAQKVRDAVALLRQQDTIQTTGEQDD